MHRNEHSIQNEHLAMNELLCYASFLTVVKSSLVGGADRVEFLRSL